MSGVRDFIMKTLPNGFPEVSIENEILNYKRNHKDQPTIVIDLFSIPLYSNKYNNLCGGRNTHCLEIINFFEKLKKLNVNIIFVKKINKSDDSLESRMRMKYKLHLQIIDELKAGTTFEGIIQTYGHRLQYPVLIKNDMYILASKYGTIIQPLDYNDVAPYLASIAFNFKAIGVISDKISLMFYKGNYHFWSGHNLKLDTLTTCRYNRDEFRKYLELTDKQMPIFSTLLGNNSITFDNVKKFHTKFGENLVENLASYVNNFSEILTEEDIDIISSDIDCKQKLNINISNLLKTSINSMELVEIQRPKDEILELVWETMSSNLYLIVSNLPLVITCSYYDYRRREQIAFPDIVMPLIRKQVGVLWKHKSDQDLVYTFYSQRFHNRFKSTEIAKPIYPEDLTVPPLVQLLDQKSYRLLDPIRFELLCWVVSDKLKPNILKNIPKEYLIEVLTLRFMVNEKLLCMYEADAILLTTNAVLDKRVPTDISLPAYLKLRPFHLVHLFTELRYLMQLVVESVGLQDRITVFNFDGVYFHNLYMDWAAMQQPDRMATLRKHPPLPALMQVYRDHSNNHRDNNRTGLDSRSNSRDRIPPRYQSGRFNNSRFNNPRFNNPRFNNSRSNSSDYLNDF